MVAASGAGTPPVDANTPPEWMKKVPLLRQVPDYQLVRISLLVNCALVALVGFVALSNFFTANEKLWAKWVGITQALLKNAPAAAWASYKQAVTAHPWATSMTISGVTYLLADWTAQTFEGRHFLGINTMRLLRSALVGALILGPFAHGYYHFQDTFFDAYVPHDWGLGASALKILLDQTIYVACYNVMFYMGLGLFALKDPRESWAEFRKIFWRLMKAGWKVWPLVHCFTYTIVPTSHKLLWVDTVEVAWVTFLSMVANEKKRQTTEVIVSETQEAGAKSLEAEFEKRSEELMVEAQVREMIESNAMDDMLASMEKDGEKGKEAAAALVVAEYIEERKERRQSMGRDPGLALLDAIEAEMIVQSEVANVLRQAGMDSKSLEDLSHQFEERQSTPRAVSGAVQAAVAEHLHDISIALSQSVQEMARQAAAEEVAKVAQTLDDEKTQQIEELKEALSTARSRLKQQEEKEEGEPPIYERNWMGPNT